MDVEDLLAASEVADDVVDFFAGVFEHFGDGSLAEVEAVVGVLVHGLELLEPVDGAHDAGNSAVFVVFDAGVLWVAGHLDFVFFGDGDDAG